MPAGKLKEEVILGIDPGLADTGYGLIKKIGSKLALIDYGSIKTDKKLDLPQRLAELEKKLNALIKKYHPKRAAVEDLYFCKNAKTALIVGQARGVVLLILRKNNVPILSVTPLQVKQAVTGYGQAEKKQVQQMVKTILNLKTAPQPDDAADALAAAVCSASYGSYARG